MSSPVVADHVSQKCSIFSSYHTAFNTNTEAVINYYFVTLVSHSSVAPSVEIFNTMLITVEGSNVTLSCNASGKPPPIITWTRIGDSEVFPQGSSISVVNVTRPGTPDNMIQYQCTASNGVKSPAKAVANITVHCKYDVHPSYCKSSNNIMGAHVNNQSTNLHKKAKP